MTVRIGWLEIAFAVVLAIYATLAMLGVTGPSRAVLKLVLAVLGFWLAIRISRAVVKQMLWRLRNRLIVAYFFIAVVPIILITLLAGLGVALVGGQISIYLVTSELERRTVSLRASIDLLARDTHGETWMENIARFLQGRYPGLQLVIQDNRRLAFPDDAASPRSDWPKGNGLTVKDGLLYGWAYTSYR